ncbi:hypothetical protein LPJ64_003507 [Coemansia asiatica]|uniref:Peptidase S1 domain-containing protein n=1 Tax=Coemansia asiatica TaxID=1052880 RepID=A0A9W7XHR8_9FUNG|nr:hypothetical protein LPJ64_003507 [Coemansia asiatica]
MLIAGTNPEFPIRVYGGQPVAYSENLSFVANVISLDPVHRGKKCSGALITNNTVLTTANCLISNSQSWYNPHLISVSFNGGSNKFMVRNTITASGYHLGMFSDNIGLITLASSVAPEIARPIGVYSGPLDESLDVYSLGYGRVNDTVAGTSPKHAQIVQMQLMPNSQCLGYAEYDRNTQVCANGKDRGGLCGGDEGSPLVTEIGNADAGYALVGIASFRTHRPDSQDEGCGRRNGDGLVYYEKGAPWAAWISRMTGVSAESLLVAGGQSGMLDESMHVSAQSGAVHGSNSSINTLDQDTAESKESSASSHNTVWWSFVFCVFTISIFGLV